MVSLALASGVELGDVCDCEAEAVISAGTHRDRNGDRDVESRDDEGEASGFVDLRNEVIDRRRAKQVFRVAFVVGVDGDQTGLRVGGAFGLGQRQTLRIG